jgi:hypothetical protein
MKCFYRYSSLYTLYTILRQMDGVTVFLGVNILWTRTYDGKLPTVSRTIATMIYRRCAKPLWTDGMQARNYANGRSILCRP